MKQRQANMRSKPSAPSNQKKTYMKEYMRKKYADKSFQSRRPCITHLSKIKICT
jgi:hypothetical protein